MIDYRFSNLSPFVPLSSGTFEIDHRFETPQFFSLSSLDMGVLSVPSGRLVVADPFYNMQRLGNHFIAISPGNYPVSATIANVSVAKDGGEAKEVEVEAYLSMVLNTALIERRQAWQQRQIALNRSPSIPASSLSFLHLTADGKHPEDELEPEDFLGCEVNTGTACFVDALCLEHGMPEESPGFNWYDNIFAHGVDQSWFDKMDETDNKRPGIANIKLPLVPPGVEEGNLILCHSGFGAGVYPVIAEWAFDYRDEDSADELNDPPAILVAIHLDFQIFFHKKDNWFSKSNKPYEGG